MKLLLDEMYSGIHADALRTAGIDASTVFDAGLAGRADPEVFAAAVAEGQAVLTENVADFTRISAQHLSGGGHHPGVLIALSSRFSRRAAGVGALAAAIASLADQSLEDRVVYLRRSEPERGSA